MTRAYFVSDIHLKNPAEPKSVVFLKFLDRLLAESKGPERATHLFLVGDIFDLWVGEHEYFRDRFRPMVDKIAAIAKAGVEVHYFEGNHDLHLEGFWHSQLGVHVHRDQAYFDLAGQRVRVEHGDLINPDDKGYLFLRWFLRTPVMTSLALNLPDRAVTAIGRRASDSSRKYTSTAKSLPMDQIRECVRSHAKRVFRDEPFDLLISGHVHVKDDFTFDESGRKVRSVNLGSWYDLAKAFVLTETSAEFIDLE